MVNVEAVFTTKTAAEVAFQNIGNITSKYHSSLTESKSKRFTTPGATSIVIEGVPSIVDATLISMQLTQNTGLTAIQY